MADSRVSYVTATLAAKWTAVQNQKTPFYQKSQLHRCWDNQRAREAQGPRLPFYPKMEGLGVVVLHNSSTASDRWQRYLSAQAYTQILSLPPSLSANPRQPCKNRHGARDCLWGLGDFLRAENLQRLIHIERTVAINQALKNMFWFIGSRLWSAFVGLLSVSAPLPGCPSCAFVTTEDFLLQNNQTRRWKECL